MTSVSKVYVHVGPFKSGTTFIQGVLYNNRDRLAANGVVLPRETWPEHIRSVVDLLRRQTKLRAPVVSDGEWDVLVEEVQAATDASTAVISMEFLCTASSEAVARLVGSLAPAEVHVIYTARDLVKVIPSAWQTVLRTGHAPSWDEWLASVRTVAQEAPAASGGVLQAVGFGRAKTWGSKLWRQQDPRQVLPAWLEHVPADRVHVVTVPPSSAVPGQLWERFCSVVGMDPGAYDTEVPRSNASLGGVECEVLRGVNMGAAGRIPGDVYGDLVKRFVAREVLERRHPQSYPLVLPDEERTWLGARSVQAAAFLGGSGFQLYGDLGELDSTPLAGEVRRPGEVSDAELLPVVQETLAEVVVEMARRQGLRPFQGPRSHEAPLPRPEELGLTGNPPGPGSRGGSGKAASGANVKAARRAARQAVKQQAHPAKRKGKKRAGAKGAST
jgi:hypothetical protein